MFKVSTDELREFTFLNFPESIFNVKEILKAPFDGIMIDNGASKTPSGLPSCLRYCAHTGKMPTLKPSTRSFTGIGHGKIKSLGLADVRMPISEELFLEFDVDLINQDVPLMFGLDKHLKHGCSTNEYKKKLQTPPQRDNCPLKDKEQPSLFAVAGDRCLVYSIRVKKNA